MHGSRQVLSGTGNHFLRLASALLIWAALEQRNQESLARWQSSGISGVVRTYSEDTSSWPLASYTSGRFIVVVFFLSFSPVHPNSIHIRKSIEKDGPVSFSPNLQSALHRIPNINIGPIARDRHTGRKAGHPILTHAYYKPSFDLGSVIGDRLIR